jgi:hypothetical protein
VNSRGTFALLSWVLAAAALWFVSSESLAERVAPALFGSELAALDRAAGIRDADGRVRVDPVVVRVEVDGPPWVQSAALAAVAQDPAYLVAQGPHRLLGEFALDGHAAAARWSLERRGWAVRAPAPTARRLLPALAWAPLLLALLAHRRWRRPAMIAAATAVATQALALGWPWPSGLPAPTLADQLRTSPAIRPLLELAAQLDERGVAIAGGVIALCLVLAWFDHRRSPDRPVPVAGFVIAIAALVWCEAAVRVSCGAWLVTPSGALSLLGAVGYLVLDRRGPTPGRIDA